MLNPKPRSANVADAPRAKSSGGEIAQWLLTMLRITGAWEVGAYSNAAWKSDSAVEPSPIQADAISVPPPIAEAIAHPTAWMYCVARLPEIEKNPCAFDEYRTGSGRPRSGSGSFEKT